MQDEHRAYIGKRLRCCWLHKQEQAAHCGEKQQPAVAPCKPEQDRAQGRIFTWSCHDLWSTGATLLRCQPFFRRNKEVRLATSLWPSHTSQLTLSYAARCKCCQQATQDTVPCCHYGRRKLPAASCGRTSRQPPRWQIAIMCRFPW